MGPWHRLVPAVLLALAAGCAGRLAPFPETAGARVELTEVPFFPQRTHQCGPAALATVLAHDGVTVGADDLVPEIYLPGRKGSLQPEIVAAIRRRDRVPYLLGGGLDELVAEIDAGRPVLLLQNLGVALFPFWHYAVAIGYDREQDEIVLRSGTTERRVERRAIFLRTWARSQFWALVVLSPGELPARAEPARYFAALASLEAVGRSDVALAGYRAMAERWPGAAEGHFGLGNVLLARGDGRGAEAAYRRAVAAANGAPAVRNNLAMALLQRGCGAAAVAEAERALAALPAGDPMRGAIEDTLRQARARAAAPDAAECPPP